MINIFQYLYDTKGKKIPFKYKLLNNIPFTQDDLLYDGDLDLRRSKITYLPYYLIVNGNLELYDSGITSLPKMLTVMFYLDIRFTDISELPDDLIVKGSLYCGYTPLAERIKKDPSLLEKYKQQVKGRIHYA